MSDLGKYLSCSAVASMPFPWLASLRQGGMSYYGLMPFWAKTLSLTRDFFLYLDFCNYILKHCQELTNTTLQTAICELQEPEVDSPSYQEDIDTLDDLRKAITSTFKEVRSLIESLERARISEVCVNYDIIKQ